MSGLTNGNENNAICYLNELELCVLSSVLASSCAHFVLNIFVKVSNQTYRLTVRIIYLETTYCKGSYIWTMESIFKGNICF